MGIADEIRTGNLCMTIGIVGSIVIVIAYYLFESGIVKL